MKRYQIPFLLLLAVSINLSAQSLIAVQNGSDPQFFVSLDSALTSAQNGDTLYIPGYTYKADFIIDKKLHLIGVGHNPDSTVATGMTRFVGDVFLDTGSDYGSIEGIYLDGTLRFGTSEPKIVKGYSASRCNLGAVFFRTKNEDSQVRYSNNLIVECIVRGSVSAQRFYSGPYNFNNVQSNSFLNCLIMKGVDGLGSDCRIKNNIIIATPNSGGFALWLRGCIIENNIFYMVSVASTMYYCTVRNNLCDNNILYWNTNGDSNLFINNISNQPLAESTFNDARIWDYSFNYDFDYQLRNTSPGIRAGTDGTDIGIYGGSFPWKEGSIPPNPHIQYKEVASKTDNAGNLKVRMVVKAQER